MFDSLMMVYVILIAITLIPVIYCGFVAGAAIVSVVRRFFHSRSLRQRIERCDEFIEQDLILSWGEVNDQIKHLVGKEARIVEDAESRGIEVEDHPGFGWLEWSDDRLRVLTLLREYIWEYGQIRREA